jgi:hypothetical protein
MFEEISRPRSSAATKPLVGLAAVGISRKAVLGELADLVFKGDVLISCVMQIV